MVFPRQIRGTPIFASNSQSQTWDREGKLIYWWGEFGWYYCNLNARHQVFTYCHSNQTVWVSSHPITLCQDGLNAAQTTRFQKSFNPNEKEKSQVNSRIRHGRPVWKKGWKFENTCIRPWSVVWREQRFDRSHTWCRRQCKSNAAIITGINCWWCLIRATAKTSDTPRTSNQSNFRRRCR